MANLSSCLQQIVTRTAVLALLWWALTGGTPESWRIGLPVVGAAVLLSFAIRTPLLSFPFVVGVFRFIPFFLILSLRGGIDVAQRAMSVRPILAPDCIEYPVELATDSARVFFANCISLLPGTLTVELGQRSILVHVLDRNRPVEHELQRLENRIARLFGIKARQGGA